MRHHFQTVLFYGSILFSTFSARSAGPAVILDSLSGSAEVQRAGSTQWVSIKQDEKLFNNDIVRIIQGGVGRLRWPDKTAAYMRGGTQILVNIGADREKSTLINYATVFVGSVFFVIKNVLPVKQREEIRMYTPTSVITIRGTSFAVDVEPETGTTSVKVLCGTIRVGCIKKSVSAFMGAPGKTVIEMETDPIVMSALLDADLDSLRLWVPRDVIDGEVAAHLAQSRRDRLLVSGKMDEKCIILPFTNESKYRGAWDIGHAVPRMLARRLLSAYSSLNITAIDSPCSTPADAAAKTKARFVISGTFTLFDIINHAEITVGADDYYERSSGRINIDLSIFDAAEKVMVYTGTVTGERTGKKNTENSWNTIGKKTFDLENGDFSSSLIGSALDQALDAAVENVSNALYR
ncbi:MAG: FecR domain-containing protein [Chitinispirillaceae bacterium]|nr:FecR domain-containing protein [Chitinispirillaceae bacterium]